MFDICGPTLKYLFQICTTYLYCHGFVVAEGPINWKRYPILILIFLDPITILAYGARLFQFTTVILKSAHSLKPMS